MQKQTLGRHGNQCQSLIHKQVPLQDKDDKSTYTSEDMMTKSTGKVDWMTQDANTIDISSVSTLKIYKDVGKYWHTKVITDINIQCPYRLVRDKLKVDGGAKSDR